MDGGAGGPPKGGAESDAADPPSSARAEDADGEQSEDEAGRPRALVASLGEWWVAVRADDVDGVVRPAPVTPLGGTPRWLAGVAAVRGRVLPVVDVARLTSAAGELGGEWWVVVSVGGRAAALAGLRVWRVVPVAEGSAADADVAPAPPGLPGRGVVRLEADAGRGASALPPAARLLDAAALLDLTHDPAGG